MAEKPEYMLEQYRITTTSSTLIMVNWPVLAMVKVNSFEEAVSASIEAEHGFGHTAIIHSQRMDRVTQFARAIRVNLFVANGPCGAILGNGGEGWTAYTIAGPTGEGPCTPKTFSRVKRFAIADSLRVV